MDTRPTIFVSYCQKFSHIKDLFVTLLDDFGLRAVVFNHGATRSPIEKERELIKGSDGFLGLLTPDQKTDDGTFLASSTVITECGMAYAEDKPIQLFAINGIAPTSVQLAQANAIPRLSILNAESPERLALEADNVRQVIRTLIEFKQQIDRVYEGKEKSRDALFTYRHFRIEQEIVSPEELRIHNSIDAVVLENISTHTHASRLLCERDTGSGIQLEEGNWQFKLFRPLNCTATVRIVQNDYSSFRFNIDFDPPLPAGADLKYEYRRKHSNYFPYTESELRELVSEGKVKHRVMAEHAMIGQDFFVTQPTDLLTIRMRFPPGYRISEYKGLVCHAKSEQIHERETERVNKCIELELDDFDKIYTLCMDVSDPHLHLSYYLLYSPPRKVESGE